MLNRQVILYISNSYQKVLLSIDTGFFTASTHNNNPVPVKYSLQTEISTKMKRILQLHAKEKKIVFPDISRLENLMLKETASAG